ncbi:MAG: 16S rRNA (guanine(527)-N(7))-methyltransferase RsmG [Christensenellales bacterium]|jgi:16S rRNA (guanine527-N7)-methyltransferase
MTKLPIIEAFETLGGIDDTQRLAFERYYDLIIEWNEKINLTRITDPKEAAYKHFADSAALEKHIKCGASVIDVGTGAGFPGIPLKIVRPDMQLTLLDSLKKRVDFLSLVLNELSIDATTLHSRAEDAARSSLRESFDIATARAVAPLNVLVEYCLPFVKTGGQLLAMKGAAAQEEVDTAAAAIKLMGGRVRGIYPTPLPGFDHAVVVIEKIEKTPKAYPRQAGKISKLPL